MPQVLPGLSLVVALVVGAFAVNALVPAASVLTVAVILGFLVTNTLGLPRNAAAGVALAAKRLLRLGVALLGAGVSTAALTELGVGGLLAVIGTVVVTIAGVMGLARVMGLPTDLGVLIGVGYGICGASAIAAVRPHTRASEQETSYAIALVALCGTLSIGVLPAVGALVDMTDLVFGQWVGAAVHDVGQVVATASIRGEDALHAAVVVKLARVALLAPVIVFFTLRNRRITARDDTARVAPLPLFVVGFLALAGLQSAGLLPHAAAAPIAALAKVLLACGLAALGLGVRWQQLRAVGVRPLVLGLAAWGLVAGVAFLAFLPTR